MSSNVDRAGSHWRFTRLPLFLFHVLISNRESYWILPSLNQIINFFNFNLYNLLWRCFQFKKTHKFHNDLMSHLNNVIIRYKIWFLINIFKIYSISNIQYLDPLLFSFWYVLILFGVTFEIIFKSINQKYLSFFKFVDDE